MADQNKVKIHHIIIGLHISPKGFEPDRPPLSPIFCLKKREKMKEVEEREDCFILDFDPYYDVDSLDLSQLSINKNLESNVASDVSVVAEKGQVACRDYPHPRHVCVKNPFERTSHESFCEMCYCYICDVPAPCKNWTGASGHCHATDDGEGKLKRNLSRQLRGHCVDLDDEAGKFEREIRSLARQLATAEWPFNHFTDSEDE